MRSVNRLRHRHPCQPLAPAVLEQPRLEAASAGGSGLCSGPASKNLSWPELRSFGRARSTLTSKVRKKMSSSGFQEPVGGFQRGVSKGRVSPRGCAAVGHAHGHAPGPRG